MRQPNNLRSEGQPRGAPPVRSKEWGLRSGRLATLLAHFNDHFNAQQSRQLKVRVNEPTAKAQ